MIWKSFDNESKKVLHLLGNFISENGKIVLIVHVVLKEQYY